MSTSRRKMLLGLGGVGIVAFAGKKALAADDEDGLATPIEDLMREHAVLDRVLLVYEEAARRIDAGMAFDRSVVVRAARLIRGYIEDHHERDEERYIFPRVALRDLVKTLVEQHRAGRALTSAIMTRPDEAANLRAFIRMYRPHAARENTILFPAFRRSLSAAEYEDLHETLEEEEVAKFGPDLWERTLAEVAELEGALSI